MDRLQRAELLYSVYKELCDLSGVYVGKWESKHSKTQRRWIQAANDNPDEIRALAAKLDELIDSLD
jgi:hypothetical protein